MELVSASANQNINRISRLLANPSHSIKHVHIHGYDCKELYKSVQQAIDVLGYSYERSRTNYLRVELNGILLNGTGTDFFRDFQDSLKSVHRISDMHSFSSVADVIHQLHARHHELKLYIFIHAAERLASYSSNDLSAIFALPNSVGNFVRIVTTSTLAWSEMITISNVSSPVECRIAPPSQGTQARSCQPGSDDIITQIIAACPDIPTVFIRFVSQVFSTQELNTNYLQTKVVEAWKIFRINNRSNEQFSIAKANHSIDLLKKRNPMLIFDRNFGQRTQKDIIKLDMASRFLLLAAYYAGQNTQNTDKRFFTSLHGRERRNEKKERSAAIAYNAKPEEQRFFDSTRLIMLYKALLKLYPVEGFEPTGDIKTRIADLVTMGILQKTSSDCNLDCVRFKCHADAESVRKAASRIRENFDLNAHLEHRA